MINRDNMPIRCERDENRRTATWRGRGINFGSMYDFDIPAPEEDEAINAGIAAGPDTSEAGDDWFATALTSEEVAPHILTRYRRTRGPQKSPTRHQIHIRLNADIVERFRCGGPGWQTRLNAALRQAIFTAEAPP